MSLSIFSLISISGLKLNKCFFKMCCLFKYLSSHTRRLQYILIGSPVDSDLHYNKSTLPAFGKNITAREHNAGGRQVFSKVYRNWAVCEHGSVGQSLSCFSRQCVPHERCELQVSVLLVRLFEALQNSSFPSLAWGRVSCHTMRTPTPATLTPSFPILCPPGESATPWTSSRLCLVNKNIALVNWDACYGVFTFEKHCIWISKRKISQLVCIWTKMP